MNVFVLVAIYKTFRHIKAGGQYDEEDLNILFSGGGFLARIFQPMFRVITRSSHMYPLGFLFALGFDTATEIGVLGMSATGASQGMSLWSVLVLSGSFHGGNVARRYDR